MPEGKFDAYKGIIPSSRYDTFAQQRYRQLALMTEEQKHSLTFSRLALEYVKVQDDDSGHVDLRPACNDNVMRVNGLKNLLPSNIAGLTETAYGDVLHNILLPTITNDPHPKIVRDAAGVTIDNIETKRFPEVDRIFLTALEQVLTIPQRQTALGTDYIAKFKTLINKPRLN